MRAFPTTMLAALSAAALSTTSLSTAAISSAGLACAVFPMAVLAGAPDLSTTPASVTGTGATKPLVAGDVGARLDRYLNESHFEGGALVARYGQIVLLKGYGMADREKQVPWAVDTLISIGSITKQFTAAAILKLEMEGKLKVEDTLSKFFKEAPEDKRAITIHQLLTHTAALDSDFAGDYEPVGRDDYVKRILSSRLRGEIGKEHFYANSGYSLLAAIVEIASGQSYESYLREHLLLPAGLRETGYRLPKWEPRRIPVGYKDGDRWGTMLDKPWAPDGPYWALRGNGGIESTLADLWAWSRALDGNAMLSDAERKKLFTPHVKEGRGAHSSYAYGWSVSTTPWSSRLVSHDGGNGVFSADFRRYVDDGIVVITASNASRVKAWAFSGPLARIAHGESVEPERPKATALRPLSAGPRDAVLKAFEAAFNSHSLDSMHAFRSAHVERRPDGPTEEQRDQMTKKMWADLGIISIEGVLAEEASILTVRAKTTQGPPLRMRFSFTAENRVTGIMLEAGGDEGPD